MIIIRFPEPFISTSAKSGVIVVDRKTSQTRYFTLEASFGGSVIVEITEQGRNNTCITVADKEGDFLEFSSIVFQLAVKRAKNESTSTEPVDSKTGQAGAGESVIALSLNALIEQMSSRYPEWKGLLP